MPAKDSSHGDAELLGDLDFIYVGCKGNLECDMMRVSQSYEDFSKDLTIPGCRMGLQGSNSAGRGLVRRAA